MSFLYEMEKCKPQTLTHQQLVELSKKIEKRIKEDMKEAYKKDNNYLEYYDVGRYTKKPHFSKEGAYYRDYKTNLRFTFKELFEALKLIFLDDEKIIVTHSFIVHKGSPRIRIKWGNGPIIGLKRKVKKRHIKRVPLRNKFIKSTFQTSLERVPQFDLKEY